MVTEGRRGGWELGLHHTSCVGYLIVDLRFQNSDDDTVDNPNPA